MCNADMHTVKMWRKGQNSDWSAKRTVWVWEGSLEYEMSNGCLGPTLGL